MCFQHPMQNCLKKPCSHSGGGTAAAAARQWLLSMSCIFSFKTVRETPQGAQHTHTTSQPVSHLQKLNINCRVAKGRKKKNTIQKCWQATLYVLFRIGSPVLRVQQKLPLFEIFNLLTLRWKPKLFSILLLSSYYLTLHIQWLNLLIGTYLFNQFKYRNFEIAWHLTKKKEKG